MKGWKFVAIWRFHRRVGAVPHRSPMRSPACSILAAALASASLCFPAGRAKAQDVVSREDQLKALFIYNFGSYIEWPSDTFSSPTAPFVIGVLGESEVNEHLREIAATKTISGHPMSVATFATPRDVKPCQILFISRNMARKEHLAEIAAERGKPVLLVGEADGFAAAGGCVNFYVEANKIRFEINLASARDQQLKVSSKLLALAKVIGADSPEAAKR